MFFFSMFVSERIDWVCMEWFGYGECLIKNNRKTSSGSKGLLRDQALMEIRKGTSIGVLRKNNFSPSVIYSALEVFLPEAERLVSDTQDSLKSLRTQVAEAERKKTELDAQVLELTALYESKSTQLAKAEQKLPAIKEELEKAEGHLTDVKREMVDSEKQREKVLRDNKTTIYDCEWFRKTSNRLIMKGLDIHDLDKVEPLLENITKLGCDPWRILDFYTQSGDLKKESEKLRVQIADNDSRLARVNEELKEKTIQLKDKAEMEVAVKKLEARELSPDHVHVIAEKIIQISAIRGLGAKEAIDKLVGDIATQYDEKLGFEAERNREKAKRDQLTQEISILEEDKRLLDVEYSAKRDALISLQEVNRLGIANSEVVMWRSILTGQREDLASFRKSMDELGGLKGYMESKSKTIKDLEAREGILSESIASKKEALIQLDDIFITKNKEYSNIFFEGVKKLDESLRTLDEDFNSPETGLKKRSEKLVASTLSDISRVSSNVNVASTRQLEEVKKKINEVVVAVEKVKESAFRAGEVMGKYSNLKPLLSLYVGEKADPDQVRVSIIAVLDAISMWLSQQEYSQSKESCDRFKATLREEWLNVPR